MHSSLLPLLLAIVDASFAKEETSSIPDFQFLPVTQVYPELVSPSGAFPDGPPVPEFSASDVSIDKSWWRNIASKALENPFSDVPLDSYFGTPEGETENIAVEDYSNIPAVPYTEVWTVPSTAPFIDPSTLDESNSKSEEYSETWAVPTDAPFIDPSTLDESNSQSEEYSETWAVPTDAPFIDPSTLDEFNSQSEEYSETWAVPTDAPFIDPSTFVTAAPDVAESGYSTSTVLVGPGVFYRTTLSEHEPESKPLEKRFLLGWWLLNQIRRKTTSQPARPKTTPPPPKTTPPRTTPPRTTPPKTTPPKTTPPRPTTTRKPTTSFVPSTFVPSTFTTADVPSYLPQWPVTNNGTLTSRTILSGYM